MHLYDFGTFPKSPTIIHELLDGGRYSIFFHIVPNHDESKELWGDTVELEIGLNLSYNLDWIPTPIYVHPHNGIDNVRHPEIQMLFWQFDESADIDYRRLRDDATYSFGVTLIDNFIQIRDVFIDHYRDEQKYDNVVRINLDEPLEANKEIHEWVPVWHIQPELMKRRDYYHELYNDKEIE